jgi:NAD(P)-dependent dehydrogenase (short-subunit alcohol dehydrogenase family)
MKLALVTGGCHRLGAAIAGRLAEAGWALALHSREHPEPDPALLARLVQFGAQWHGFSADLSDPGDVAGLINQVAGHFGQAPGLLVNNASMFGPDGPEEMTAETLVAHFTINSAAPMLLARDVAARARGGEPAAIVNILDQRIVHPAGDQASYTVSKLALAGATDMLARALAPHARVCAVAPGLTLPTDDYLPAQMMRLQAEMPLGLLPDPEDVADAVAYLAGAVAVTGQIIFVDGGAHLRSFGRDFLYLGRDEA